LKGLYEFRLEYVGKIVLPTSPGEAVEPREPDGSEPDGPDIFRALEQQLGLRLAPVKTAPVQVLVVDKLDKTPVAN
jgi:uncharacterized protein (TIGR03435 family)